MTDAPTYDPHYVPDVVRIADQNDRFRRQVCAIAPGLGRAKHGALSGRVVFTQAVAARGPLFPLLCLLAVAGHDVFDPEDDPDRLHDFGEVTVQGASGSGSRSTSTRTRRWSGAPSARTIRPARTG